jgi:hypothetical protein
MLTLFREVISVHSENETKLIYNVANAEQLNIERGGSQHRNSVVTVLQGIKRRLKFQAKNSLMYKEKSELPTYRCEWHLSALSLMHCGLWRQLCLSRY